MADRTVVARLVLDVAGYTPAAEAASKSTSALATAQKEAGSVAKAAGIAQRDAAMAAKEASATASASAQAMKAAMTEAASAAKAASAAQVDAATASTDAERVQAEAIAKVATERAVAAKEALDAAKVQAEADARAAATAKAGATEAAKYAHAQRDAAAAAKESAAAESTAARESAAASKERSDAYKSSGTAMGTMALVTGAAIGLMVKDAGDFQSSTQHLVTDAGESQANLAMVQAGILKTATATGTGATQLVDAMYHIESAGFHGKAGLDMLTVSAQGAKVGAADLGTVAKTLTGTMNSYSESGYTSAQMMNMLIATVGAGDMKMNDLAGSLGNVAPKAASAGIKFNEVGAAIATMTSQNMSADQATQDLAFTIGALQKPSNIQIQQMQQLGLDSNDVSMNLGKRGLTGTLELLTTAVANHTQNGQVFIDTLKNSKNAAADADAMIKQLPPSIQDVSKKLLDGSVTAAQYNKAVSGLDAPQQHMAKQFEQLVKTSGSFNDLLKSGKPEAETFNAAMSNLTGGATGLNTALMLTGGRMQTFKDNAVTIQDAANKGGTQVDNWSKIQGTFNQKIDVAKASLGALGIAIGTTLLPVISGLAKGITDIVTPIAGWVDKHQTLTAVVLGSTTALAALVLMINGAMKAAGLVKNAIDGVKTAVDFFSRSAATATVETEALGTANAATAKETNAAATASSAAAVKAKAMGAAQASAATEIEAATLSAGGWASKLGSAIPIVGAAALGIGLLSSAFSHTSGDAAQATASVDQFTTAMVQSKNSTSDASMAFGHAADDLNVLSEALAGKLAVNTKFEGKDVADLKRSFDYLAESSVASVEPMAQLGVELGKVNQVSGEAKNSLASYDGGLANLVNSGQLDRARQLMAEISQVTDNHGKALINTARDFPQYFAALDKLKSDQVLGISTTQSATAATGANTGALDANAAAASGSADATGTATTAQAAQAKATASAALQLYQSAAAAQAMAQAQSADATAAKDLAAAHTSAKGAVAGHATETKDAAAATKDAAAASAKDATAAKDSAKASTDQGKAATDAAKANAAGAKAADSKAAADAAGGKSAKLNAAATRDAAAAARAATTENNADAKAAAASGTAHTAAGKAIDAHTKAVDASAKAASDAARAAGGDQAAQDAAAESARQAALVHEVGTKWLLAVADAEASASGSAGDLDQSVKDEVTTMKDAKTAASNLKDGLDALNGVHIAASKAAIDVQQKIADLTKAFGENGRTLDITTEAGRKNVTAIDDMASAANAHAQSVAEESGSIAAGNKALDASRAEFDAVLKSAGFSTGQIEQFNRTLLNTPKLAPVTLQVKADTSSADAALNALAGRYAGIVVGGGPGGKKIFSAYATGGLVSGYGTGTSDSNTVAVSNREYIVNAAAVARPGVLADLNALNFGTSKASIVRPQISAGGAVGGGAGGHGGGSVAGVQVELVSSGAEDYWLRAIRQSIRLRGGNVQQVLGS